MFDSLLNTQVNFMPLVLIVLTSVGIPLATFFAKLGISELCSLLKPYIGEKQATEVQKRADALLDKGIGEAVLHFLPMLQAQGLTVDLGNAIAARVADYAVNHAPDFAPKLSAFEGAIQEKVKGRLVAHPAVQAAVTVQMLPSPAVAHPAAAAA